MARAKLGPELWIVVYDGTATAYNEEDTARAAARHLSLFYHTSIVEREPDPGVGMVYLWKVKRWPLNERKDDRPMWIPAGLNSSPMRRRLHA